MGFWNWFLTALVGNPAERTPERSSQQGTCQSGGVAVLERDESTASRLDPDDAEPWWAPEGAALLERAPKERPEMSPEARVIENLIASHFDGHDLTLPSIPRVAERVLSRLGSAYCDFAEVATDIAEDQVLAAETLRMANSPFYRGQEKFTALLPAVTRLGIRPLRALMMQHSIRSATTGHRKVDQELAGIVWRRSLASSIVMMGLSAFTKVDEEDAFMIGLLHDIGNVVVLRIVSGQELMTKEPIDLEAFEYLCYECQQEFGELIATEWKLPEKLQSLITDHHDHPPDDDPLRTERLQLILTDMILEMIGFAPQVEYDLLNSRVVKELGLSKRLGFVHFLCALPQEVDEAMSTLS
ncbi:MAG: HDOD domain-containing protein [Phycisphaerales bacterium]|nr:MAG: HDOD domain-containing protein [Phycisphaerales bacterium]